MKKNQREDRTEVNHAWNVLYAQMRKLPSCDLQVMAYEINDVLAERCIGESVDGARKE